MSDVSDATPRTPAMTNDAELDFRAVGHTLWRKRNWVLVPALIAAALAFAAVNLVTPLYRSETRVLFDGRESVFFRPDADKLVNQDRAAADQEAITSQVQLVLSRDVARLVIKSLNLGALPEFDPVRRGLSPLRRIMVLVGIVKDPLSLTPQERVLDSYYERISAFQVEKSRVIAIQFSSSDPALAARGANAIAAAYMALQQEEKQAQTRAASKWLSGEIDKLRTKVSDSEKKVADFRSRENLFFGTNNTPLSTQQLGELSSQLATARAQKADLDAKAQAIRAMLQSGRPIESNDVVNSELIRRLNEQRVTLRAQLAEQSSTLLSLHPRIKELKAQIADLERQIKIEAERLVRSFQNDAEIAGARVTQLSKAVDQLKRLAATNNGQDVQLRALEREAKAQRDLLESYLAKYREATARETLGDAPADARIISPAVVSNTPYYPKKISIILIAALAALFLSAGFITTGALLASERSAAAATVGQPAQAYPATADPALHEAIAPSLVPEAPVAEAATLTGAQPAVGPIVARLKAEGDGRSRTIVLSADTGVRATGPAIVLARELAATTRAVLVDLALTEPHVGAITDEPEAPGIFDLMRGDAVFGQVIARDRVSRLHLIASGEVAEDPLPLLRSDRLSVALAALSQTYDHVVIDGGTLDEIPAEILLRLAPQAILATAASPDDTPPAAAAAVLHEAGFIEPLVLGAAPVPAPADREAAPAVESAAA
jgi:uncharacterized protein involved in exopolysaccharide biosynthesis/Mrp family chromosome partitioning ATPase